ncbi:hypothetical protein HYT33_04020 [Candidatus Roizmanbacteria bacterium]|nr:hypothetical protein [Candidatus Roizmanbacteria bacterium]
MAERYTYRPDGRKPTQPDVRIKGSVIDKLGDPHVDYEALDNLFREEFGLPKNIVPKIRIYGRTKYAPLRGFYMPFTHTVHVQAPSSNSFEYNQGYVKIPYGTNLVVSTLIHEGQHLADHVHHPITSAAQMAVRSVTYGVGLKIGAELDNIVPLVPGFVFTTAFPYWLRFHFYYKHEPLEVRARQAQSNIELLKKYQDAITFGNQESGWRK